MVKIFLKKIVIIPLSLMGLSTYIFAQTPYSTDRVYTGNQVSNTVSVINPSTNILLGEIVLGNPYPNALGPLYRGQSLVHGLGYSPKNKVLAVVSIGSNSVTLIDTKTNKIIKTIYVGRAAHEATFTPNGNEIWVAIRGEAYISVIDLEKREETHQVPVADGPGMVAFTTDGKYAYVASSFTPQLDIIDTKTYKVIKSIPVTSPFSPNIFSSPDGKYIAMTHKDIGKVGVIDVKSEKVIKLLDTGSLTNHVTFLVAPNDHLLMPVSVGGENAIKIYDTTDDFKLIATIPVGFDPHGAWPSPDGKYLYVGLEYADQVQPVDMISMKALPPIQVGQSPQALLYAKEAVLSPDNEENLKPLAEVNAPYTVDLSLINGTANGKGTVVIRAIGLTDLIEQDFSQLKPNTQYTVALAKKRETTKDSYEINSFTTNSKGGYKGQSTGLVKSTTSKEPDYASIILIENSTGKIVMESPKNSKNR